MDIKIENVKIKKPQDLNVIIGQAHFIKTIEDLYEALVNNVPQIKCGIAFCEASGERLIRVEGNDEELKQIAIENIQHIGAGHSFFIALKDAYPINVLNQIKMVPEVCNIFCATANPLEVIVAVSEGGRGILGVIDGSVPRGVEDKTGVKWRKDLLRKIRYKL